MIEALLFEENLRPFLENVGRFVDRDFDDDNWIAVSQGLRGTDAEAGRWGEYESYKGRRAAFAIALDEAGASVVRFRVDLSQEFESRIQLLGDFCWLCHWGSPII